MPKAVQDYKVGPSRVQYLTRDPRGFAEFAAQFEAHSARGSANTLRGVQAKRPTVYELEKGRIRTVFSDAVWAAYRRTLELGEALEAEVARDPA